MKRILVIFSSPHREGYTRKLTDSFMRVFSDDEEYEIAEINAYEENIRPCIDCGCCSKTEGCAFADFRKIDKMLRESDLLVIASPIYNSTFPSPFKAILDRTQQYYNARFSLQINPPIEKKRQAVLLLTLGSKDEFAVEVTKKQLTRSFTVMNTELFGTVVWSNTDTESKNNTKAAEKATAMALEISKKM